MINYRNLINIKYFCINYQISHYCSGKSKFSKYYSEEHLSPPFIDISGTAYTDPSINSAQDIFTKQIYMNINTICQEPKCMNEANFYVKKYTPSPSRCRSFWPACGL